MGRRLPGVHVERKGGPVVASAQGRSHTRYEDRFRLLCGPISIVREAGRGEIVAVFDGIGGAPDGLKAARHMADALVRYYRMAAGDTRNRSGRAGAMNPTSILLNELAKAAGLASQPPGATERIDEEAFARAYRSCPELMRLTVLLARGQITQEQLKEQAAPHLARFVEEYERLIRGSSEREVEVPSEPG